VTYSFVFFIERALIVINYTTFNKFLLTTLQESVYNKKNKLVSTSATDIATNGEESLVTYLVEQRDMSKRYNAYCMSFWNEKAAIDYYNGFKEYKTLANEYLVPISKLFIQKSFRQEHQVYILKVSISIRTDLYFTVCFL
jgi:hypothetical protein